MPEKLPYFPFYARDFSSDAKIEAMSTREVGAYMLLLCKAWHEDPPGSIPDDDEALARWARLGPEEWAGRRARILAPFSLGEDGRYYQERMVMEHGKLAGRYGGKRKAKRPAVSPVSQLHESFDARDTARQRLLLEALKDGGGISEELTGSLEDRMKEKAANCFAAAFGKRQDGELEGYYSKALALSFDFLPRPADPGAYSHATLCADALYDFLGAFLREMPYQDYLRTQWWEATRASALARAGHRCQLCNSDGPSLDVHHRTYERRGREAPEDLIALCRPCHAKFHNKLP